MKKTDEENKMFLLSEFQQEKHKFNGLIENYKFKNIELYSDEKNYIIYLNNNDNQILIWSKDNLSFETISEIITGIEKIAKNSFDYKIICKKELFQYIKNHLKNNINNYFEMSFLTCKKTTIPKKCSGYLDIATLDDVDIIAKYWYAAHLEMNGVKPITLEISKKTTNELINNNVVYVWKKENNIIVSIGYFIIENSQAKVLGIYTNPEERRNGYAKNLVYNITNKILEKGYIATLYTDHNYIASNKTYIDIGYKQSGILISFTYLK